MTPELSNKVRAEHLKRNAYLYVRQSSLRQVLENQESTKRQYALCQRAKALGWPDERVVVIDEDQARSASSTAGRSGFQSLVADVGMNRAGIVMGLEVSRLARNNADWHRLLEICAVTETLILDEDGVYDPCHFNDRLLLGLKGTMSEAELHVLRARLRGGMLNKARRGELAFALPVGFVRDPHGKVVLDPDQQVRESLQLFFATFRRTGTAHATVKHFHAQGLRFPRRLRCGANKGDLIWGGLGSGRALELLRNPRFAGAYAFGRTRQRHGVDGKRTQERLGRDAWHTLIRDAHEGYISWQQYEENLIRINDNAQATGAGRRLTPPREGPALRQGLAICGHCGTGMRPRYRTRRDALVPEYVCMGPGRNSGAATICQSIPGAALDDAIGKLLLETFTPLALEVALGIEQELKARIDEADRLRHRDVERADYEVQLARQRFMRVDPNNRLVADLLEVEWNDKLRLLAQAQEQYERQRRADRLIIDDEQRKKVLALATDLPRLWKDPRTPARERKRMARLVIEDVTLIKGDPVKLHVRFRGGATASVEVRRARASWEHGETSAQVVADIDGLLDHHTNAEVAAILNDRGLTSGCGKPFHGDRVEWLRRAYHLKSRRERLRAAGLITLDELAAKLGRSKWIIKDWRAAGKLPVRAFRLDDVDRFMYEDPDQPAAESGASSARTEGV